jgi:hypothetical protein
MMIHLRNSLGRACEALSRLLLEASRRLRVCRVCGRSLFYGEGCKGAFLTGCKPPGGNNA